MDGTALYEAVAAIYISQCVGMDLSLGQIILVRSGLNYMEMLLDFTTVAEHP